MGKRLTLTYPLWSEWALSALPPSFWPSLTLSHSPPFLFLLPSLPLSQWVSPSFLLLPPLPLSLPSSLHPSLPARRSQCCGFGWTQSFCGCDCLQWSKLTLSGTVSSSTREMLTHSWRCVCVCVCVHVCTLLEPKCVPFQSMKYFSNVLNSRVSFPVLALWPGNETTRQGSYSHMHTRCRLLRH